jgi:ADP-ribose pyrophosphatase YjhB (NUDIX family)
MMRARFPATVHLFFLHDNKILLLRRFNTGFRDGEYSVPAGHLDGGETVAERNMTFSTVMHRIEDDERVDFFVQVHEWEGEPFNAEPDKCDDVRWVNINTLPENMVPYVRQALGNHLHNVPFDEYRL